jgi:hypothetical protein
VFYASGTVDIHVKSSNNAPKLETEEDRSNLLAFFGQIRDRLVLLLADKYEIIVPKIMKWELTECDINKDVNISDMLHLAAVKIQVKHLDHIFRIYVKSMEKNTVCRVEETKPPKKPVIEAINEIFNPRERFDRARSSSGPLCATKDNNAKRI